MESTILAILTMLSTGSEQTRIIPSFWDELEELLGPIWQPIVGPLFDVLREESYRLMMLSTIVTVCIFVVVITFVVYEVPSIINWLIGGAGLSSLDTKPPPPKTTRRREPRRASRAPTKKEVKAPTPVEAAVKGVNVRSLIEKERDVTILNVEIENQSDHRIEMVVTDIILPDGIDILPGSFRMQRIGTIESGGSRRCIFRLKHTEGSLSDISGHVEFMSSSYEITEVTIPSPEIL
ncbi:MAG: hypothetical protein ACW98Y_19650 [Candidatus Thorarchaeota archaeon]